MRKKPESLAYDVQGGLALDFVARGPATTNKQAMTATCVFSTDAVDRVGDRINIPGIRTENHRNNPVVFWDHAKNLTLPIGRTMDNYGAYTVVLSENEAVQTTHFSQSLLEAEQIFWLIDEKIIGANSIGFRPIKASPLYVNGRRAGLDLAEVELLEVSWVGVGCNQEAIRCALAREHICGKSLSAPLRSSLEPWASPAKVWSPGFDLRTIKSVDNATGVTEQTVMGEAAQQVDIIADILGGLLLRRAETTIAKAWDESLHHRGQPGNAGQFGSGGGGGKKPKGKPKQKPKDSAKKPNRRPSGAAKKPPNKLLGHVIQRGGISAAKLGRDWNIQEDFWQAGLGGIFRKNGVGLDDMADQLVAEGHIKVPDGQNADDYLMQALKGHISSLHEDLSSEIDAEQEAYYQELQDAEQHARESEITETVRAGKEAGRAEGQTGPLEGDAGSLAHEENFGDDDLDFNFGANEKPAKPELPAAELKPKKPAASRAGSKESQRLAQSSIASILGGEVASGAYKQLAGHLEKLTVPQLNELRKQHGLTCGGKLKSALIEKLTAHFNSKVQAGNVDAKSVARALAPFLETSLSPATTRFAKADYLAIKTIYGPRSVHRIKAVAVGDLRLFARVSKSARQDIRERLGVAAWMVRQAMRDGITGRVKTYNEADHPRGQPDNAGQFGPGGGGSGGSADKPAASSDRASKIAAQAAKMREQHGDAAVDKVNAAIDKFKASDDPQAAAKIEALKELADHLSKKDSAEAPKSEAGEPEEAKAPAKSAREQQYAATPRGAADAWRADEDKEIAETREKEDEGFSAKREATEERHAKEIEEFDGKIQEVQDQRDELASTRDDEDSDLGSDREAEDVGISSKRDDEDADIEKSREDEDAAIEKKREPVREKLDGAWQDAESDSDAEAAAKQKLDAAEEKWSAEDVSLNDDRLSEDEKRFAAREKEDEKLQAKRDKEDERREAAREKEDAKLDKAEEKLEAQKSKLEDKHADEINALDEEESDREASRQEDDDTLQEGRDEEDEFFEEEESKEFDRAGELIDKLDENEASDDEQAEAVKKYNDAAAAAEERKRIAWYSSANFTGWVVTDIDDMTDDDLAKHSSKKSLQYWSKKDISNWEESKHPRADDGKFGSGGGSGRKPKGQKPKPSQSAKEARDQATDKVRQASHAAFKSTVSTLVWLGKKGGHLEHAAQEWIGKQVDRLPAPVRLPVVGAYKAAFASYTIAQGAVRAVAAERGMTPEQIDRVAKIVGVVDVVGGGKILPGVLKASGLGAAAFAGSCVPVGSLGYLAYSTARDPMATLRAAKKGVSAAAKKIGVTKSLEVPKNSKAVIATILDQIAKASDADAWSAYFLTAMDAAGGDIGRALALTAAALPKKAASA